MTQVCPFCGAAVEAASAVPGSLPNTRLCPVCGQEHDLPTQPPEASAGGTEVPPPPPCDGLASLAEQLGRPPSAPPAAAGEPPAWEGGGGLWRRLWRTTWQVLGHPGQTLEAPALPGLGWSLGYGLILGTLSNAATVFWGVALGWSDISRAKALWSLFLSPLQALVTLFVVAAIMHAMLFVLGGAKRGFRATFRVNAYAQAVVILTLVPGVGLAAGLVWYLVVVTAGLAASHGIGKGRALASLLLPLLLLLLLVLAVVVAVGFSALMEVLDGIGKSGGGLGF